MKKVYEPKHKPAPDYVPVFKLAMNDVYCNKLEEDEKYYYLTINEKHLEKGVIVAQKKKKILKSEVKEVIECYKY